MKRSGETFLVVELETKPQEARKRNSIHSFGAQFVEVGIDEGTGELRIRRVVSAFAAGNILNPKTARSQYLGGIVWGIGFALTEHSVRDDRFRRVIKRDLADYHVPVNADVPPIEIIMVDEVDPIANGGGEENRRNTNYRHYGRYRQCRLQCHGETDPASSHHPRQAPLELHS